MTVNENPEIIIVSVTMFRSRSYIRHRFMLELLSQIFSSVRESDVLTRWLTPPSIMWPGIYAYLKYSHSKHRNPHHFMREFMFRSLLFQPLYVQALHSRSLHSPLASTNILTKLTLIIIAQLLKSTLMHLHIKITKRLLGKLGAQ